ncbi:SusC/RagA family TonB-linked outer membrane protein [Pedobacter fastidiosus]|uniref:SusC/RagA family TonB-linked outer membrane protein n=1 Tax=Pedobacter fastidiosus TaxID=2765361 RepID=A0ABR7KVB8_9SPHI|nr:SusC/RagA family TonB-linked outer membrane protein [Pedobacter fastidiosus]MBC6112054.1 SusC/RagA family TonB-linked outer membrane protein [Pedobacter fastidiosus]
MKKYLQNYFSPQLRVLKRIISGAICAIIILTSLNLKAQNAGNISINVKNAKLSDAVKAVSRQAKMQFFYNADQLDKNAKVTLSLKNKTLDLVLNTLLRGTDITYVIDKDVVIFKAKTISTSGTPSISQKKIRLTGKITDDQNKTLPGVSIQEIGQQNATSSDENGNYVLLVNDNSAVRFQYIGYKAQVKNINLANGTEVFVMNMKLQESSQGLDDVVVTGYQNIAKRDFVGSISSVKMEDIRVAGTNQIDKLLQGQLPGVAVSNTSGLVGSKPKVRVRGTSTLLGSQEPVWVVDGIIQEDPVPFDYQQLNSLSAQTSNDAIKNLVGSTVAFLNVDDIDEITVLKDAASTAIYGVKAANGVIVITTKKGKVGKTSINYSTNFTTSAKPAYNQFKLMNSKERVDVSREIYARGLQFGVTPDGVSYEGLSTDLFDKKITQEQFVAGVNKLETNNTDWFDLLFQAPISQTHSLSISGGSDRTTYYGSVGYMNDRGNTKGNQQDRYTASVNINSSLTNNLKVGIKLSGSKSKTDGFYGVDPFNYAYNASRAIPAFNNDGSLFLYTAPNVSTSGAFRYNVLNELSQTGNTNNLSSINLAANVDYKFLKDFTFQSLVGFGYNQTKASTYATETSNMITQLRGYEYGAALPGTINYLGSRIPVGGIYNGYNMDNQSVTFRNSFAYNKRLRDGKDGLNVLVGQEIRSSKYDGLAQTSYGYMPDRGQSFVQIPLTYTPTTGVVSNDLYSNTLPVLTDKLSNYLSYFGTATYNFNQKYVINGNIRTDASNRFGQYSNHRFLPIWSIGGKWNVAEENWFNDFAWLNQLSARVSYGFQGNVAENFSPDLIAQIPSGASSVNPVSGDPVLLIKSLAYKDLRWERNKTINLGLDFAIFNKRVSGSFDYYIKKGFDVIVQKSIPLEYGLLTMPINAGNINNKGFELALNFAPIRTNTFDWSINFNTSKVTNDVIQSGSVSLTSWQSAVSGGLYKEGYASSGIWSFDFAGLDHNTGTPLFNGLNATTNPAAVTDVTKALIYSGQLDPKFTGGLSNNFRYKSFTLSAFLYMSTGNVKRLAPLYPNARDASSAPYPFQNLSAELNNRWRQPGDEAFTTIPSLPSAGSVATTTVTVPGSSAGVYPRQLYDYSTARVVDASFVRLRNLSVGYIVPNAKLKSIGLKSCQIQGSVSNLFYIADKRLNGQDPEVNGNSLPIPRTYSLSLNIGI